MGDFSTVALIVLGLVAFNNYRNGTLGTWLKAKFFNAAAPPKSAKPTPLATGAAIRTPANPTGLGAGLGTLLMPVPGGVITGRVGDPRPGGRSHAGVDWAAPTGSPVYAARAGRVSYAGSAAGYGLLVKIDHGGGIETRYAHLSHIAVRLGQQVAAGERVGSVGSTGESTGPHLHFELRQGGRPLNPLDHLGFAGSAVTA